jgi:hypothetical protein
MWKTGVGEDVGDGRVIACNEAVEEWICDRVQWRCGKVEGYE